MLNCWMPRSLADQGFSEIVGNLLTCFRMHSRSSRPRLPSASSSPSSMSLLLGYQVSLKICSDSSRGTGSKSQLLTFYSDLTIKFISAVPKPYLRVMPVTK